MPIEKLDKHTYLIDVEAGEIKNFIASYVLKGKYTAIVETGPMSSIPNLLSNLKKLKIKLEEVAYVAVTHVHIDHGGGIGTLLEHLPNAKVIVHPKGAHHLANPTELWQQSREVLKHIAEIYGEPTSVPEERIITASNGMTFDIGNGVKLKVVETLGHSPHHQSYYEASSGTLFPGDAAGIYLNELDVNVPTTPPPFRLDIALASLSRLISLKPKALCYTHFGRAANPQEKLRAYTQQLRLWAEIVKQGLKNKSDLKTIREQIIKSDMAVQKALRHIEAHPVLSETTLNKSLLGLIDFVKKFDLNYP